MATNGLAGENPGGPLAFMCIPDEAPVDSVILETVPVPQMKMPDVPVEERRAKFYAEPR
jgi:hypothetical protein